MEWDFLMLKTKQKLKNLSSLANPYNLEEAAYYKWLNRGGQNGDALKDWLEAESELKAELRSEE